MRMASFRSRRREEARALFEASTIFITKYKGDLHIMLSRLALLAGTT